MAGWIIERELCDGSSVYDIGYRVNRRLVKRKGGPTRRAAESALILALAEIETGAIRDHTTDTLAAYATRWLERRRPFVESGTLDAYRNDIIFRITPTLGPTRLREITASSAGEGQGSRRIASVHRHSVRAANRPLRRLGGWG